MDELPSHSEPGRGVHRLGACTWLFGDMSLTEIAQRLSSLGFDGVELMGDLDRYAPREAADILRDQGLGVFSMTPADVDLAHPNPEIRSEAIDYFLQLLDFAAAIDKPFVACHGLVGRIRPFAGSGQEQERVLLVDAVRQIAVRAQDMGLRLVMEVLNRYESHLLNTAAEAVQFVDELAGLGIENVGILMDAYHMNIEEANPERALRLAGDYLWLYHAADSNRQAIGRGHTDFGSQMSALVGAGYAGPIILECTPPGPDPFRSIKGPDSLHWLETYLRESREWFLGANA
jgi:D-psicose/D-tagatose/L-ribulose 3-epimerase